MLPSGSSGRLSPSILGPDRRRCFRVCVLQPLQDFARAGPREVGRGGCEDPGCAVAPSPLTAGVSTGRQGSPHNLSETKCLLLWM